MDFDFLWMKCVQELHKIVYTIKYLSYNKDHYGTTLTDLRGHTKGYIIVSLGVPQIAAESRLGS